MSEPTDVAVPEPFTCKVRAAGLTDPQQDCDWPHCGCDPYADKVLAALQEEVSAAPDLRALVAKWRAEQATYPHSDIGRSAAAAVSLCAEELEAALSQLRVPQGDRWQPPKVSAVVDGRCGCAKCEARTGDIYRMIGACSNCGTKGILMLFRAGDPIATLDCPICGKWYAVHSQRLATVDEIPSAAPVPDAGEREP